MASSEPDLTARMLEDSRASVVAILATVSLSLLTVDLDRSLPRAPISPVNLSPPFCAACLHQHFRRGRSLPLPQRRWWDDIQLWLAVYTLHSAVAHYPVMVLLVLRSSLFFLKTGHRGCWQAPLLWKPHRTGTLSCREYGWEKRVDGWKILRIRNLTSSFGMCFLIH